MSQVRMRQLVNSKMMKIKHLVDIDKAMMNTNHDRQRHNQYKMAQLKQLYRLHHQYYLNHNKLNHLFYQVSFAFVLKKYLNFFFFLKDPNLMLVNPYIMQFPHLFAKHAAAIAGLGSTPQTDLLSMQNQLLNNQQLAKFDYLLGKTSPEVTQPPTNGKINDEFVNCSLCSKSFCNFEFLKLHLINKHGQNEVRYELKLHDSNANTETFCFVCEKDFPNKSLLKSHINQKHNVSSDSQKKNENTIVEAEQQQQQQQKSTINDDLNQIMPGKCLDKVICNICNKQLCNKYFLRTHKAKVHGIKFELINGLSILSGNSPQSGTNNNNNDSSTEDDCNKNKRKYNSDSDEGCVDENEISESLSQQVDEDEKENKAINDLKMPKQQASPLPTSYLKAYCELCNKELCNKYFLKSHMLNAHNINIDENEATAAATTTENVELTKNKLKKQKVIEAKYSIKNDFEMQPFLIESKEKNFTDNFVPCLVYLPVRNRIQATLHLQLQLKPLDQNQETTTTTTNRRLSVSSLNDTLVIDINNNSNSITTSN